MNLPAEGAVSIDREVQLGFVGKPQVESVKSLNRCGHRRLKSVR